MHTFINEEILTVDINNKGIDQDNAEWVIEIRLKIPPV